MDRGDEILTQLNAICIKENVKLASVSAIGATSDFTVGVFNTASKKYKATVFAGDDYEIVSLTGTVTTKDGKPYIHLHMTAAGETGVTVGGHLTCATVSVTCEMVIDVIDGVVERQLNEDIGINLLKFN